MIADALLAPALVEIGVAAGAAALVGTGAAGVKYLKRINRALSRVETQVTPNGGKSDSLGDRARRTEETVARMEGRLLDHENRLTAHAVQLATNLVQLSRNSTQLDHIEQQLSQSSGPAPSVTVNTTTTSPASEARRTPLPPPPPGASE